MPVLDDKLRDGFRLRDCTVYPSRNVIVNADGEQHVEPKAMQVLLVLTSRAGDVVTREQLLEEVWPDTFSGDAALTRCISLLRSSLGQTREEATFIETVSKSGYRLVVPVAQFNAPVPGPDPEAGGLRFSGPSGLAWLVALTLLLILGLYFLVAPDQVSDPEPMAGQSNDMHTVAILPFANMSGDPDNEYLSDGVSEEILNVLAQVPGMRVTSRSSSFAFRDTELALSEIAERLGVDSLLEGSVRTSGERIRISVQLVEADSELLLWSENYDHLLNDIFQVQEEIAQAVASTLTATLDIAVPVSLPTAVQTRPGSIEAHMAFLRGRYLAAKRTGRALEDAIDEYRRALSIEPEHVAALSELSTTYLLMSVYSDMSEGEVMAKALPLAERAIELNPRAAEAQAAIGFAAWRQGQSELAETHFLRALEINPNYAIVYHWLAMLSYRNLGKHQEAFLASRMARTLDPVSVPISNIYIQLLISRGMLREAADELDKVQAISLVSYLWLKSELESLGGRWSKAVLGHLDALKLDPTLARGKFVLTSGLIRLGLDDEAISLGAENDPGFLIRLGRAEDAVRLARQQLQAQPESIDARRDLARALVSAGEKEEAKALLEELWLLANRRPALMSTGIITLNQALALYEYRKGAGDAAGAAEIISGIDQEIERVRKAAVVITRRGSSLDFVKGIRDYLTGSEEQGLAKIKLAVENGFHFRPTVHYYETLSRDPRFEPILQIQEATRKRERQALLEVVCRDNPYAEIWQPSEATCGLLQ